MKQFLYTMLATLLLTNVQAQSITGKVVAPNGHAIEAATIRILNQEKSTVTGKQGDFNFTPVAAGTYQLSISAAGFATQLKEVTVAKNQASELTVTLTEQGEQLDDVVVTAQKNEQNNLTTPVAVTSISAKKTEEARIWGLSGLTAIVPNYLNQDLGVGFQQIQSIRGIQVFSENPAVATYIDDVNNLDILANGFALTDIEKIEVLRGPQGTLFGRNAMGGVVNIVTKKPTNKTQSFAEVSVGNLGLQRYSAGFKTPIIKNKLFVGINALYQTQDGYWKNDTTGTGVTNAAIQGKKVGGENNRYGNVYLRWLPSARFSATVNVKAQTDKSDNTGYFVLQKSESVAFANPGTINLARIGSHERNIVNTALTLKYVASKFTFTSISAYQRIAVAFKDVDFPGFYHSFYNAAIGEKLPPQQVYSQELRINTNNANAKLQYTAGVYAFSQVGYEPSSNLAYELTPTSFIVFRNKSNNSGFAAFGELSYKLTGKLKLTGGLRYDYEKREATFNGFGDATFTNGVFTMGTPDTTVGDTYTAISPKAVVSYTVGSKASLYVSYTRGFRAGGVNAQKVPANVRQQFSPEYSNNVEIGYKTQLANNSVTISAAAYAIQWKQLQFFNLVAPFTYAKDNVGDAQSIGFELEATALAVKGLQLDASLGIASTEYKSFDLKRVNFGTGAETTDRIGGNQLSNAPGHTLFIATQYTTAVCKKAALVLRGEVKNIGRFYTDIQNNLKQPSYTLLNARAGINYTGYSIFFWGQNMANKRYLAYGSLDTSFGRSVRTAAPATYGVTFTAKL